MKPKLKKVKTRANGAPKPVGAKAQARAAAVKKIAANQDRRRRNQAAAIRMEMMD